MGPLPGWGRIARSFRGIAAPHEKGRLPPDIRIPCGWLRFELGVGIRDAGIWMPAAGWAYGSIPDWGGNVFFS